jgi:phenylacetate-CoA ligase
MSSTLRSLLRQSPAAQSLARRLLSAVPPRLRLGTHFFHWYALLLEAESWSDERIAQYRQQLLTRLLTEVALHSPYYQSLLAGLNLPEVASNPARYLPVMTREEFRSQYQRIRHASYRGKLSAGSTSGTTGNALQFFHPLEDNSREWAAICHQWRRVGYDPLTSVRAELRGMLTSPGIEQHFPEHRMIRFSIVDMKREHIRQYAQSCARQKVEFLHGYPSALYLLARAVLEDGIAFRGVRGIMLASEMVYPHQIETIEAAFPAAKLIAHYGNAERVALGAWCETTRACHMLPLYSHVEVDAADGTLIGTNYFNTINPFIRYRMSDVLQDSASGRCPDCKRLATPLVGGIQGRAEDYLFSPDKGWIPPAVVTYPLKSLQKIHELQFYQHEPGRIELRYVALHGQDCSDELDDIRAGLLPLLGRVDIVPVQIEAFERGASGKFKWIVSTLENASEPAPGRQPG